jgi:copper homeostasis protein
VPAQGYLFGGMTHDRDQDRMRLEICVDSVESAAAAERGGAQRVELCSDLLEGGITPSAGLISLVRRRIRIDLFVMIRPRGGDFAYTREEFDLMREDIRQARKLGADGIVLGVLDEQARIDVPRTRELVRLARPLPVTFHRAIDMTADPETALDEVMKTGAARVLTSGGAPNVMQGLAQVARMVRAADERITVMAGGGLSLETLPRVAEATGAAEFHASLRTPSASPVDFRKRGVHMGELCDREYLRFTVQEETVRAMALALRQVAARHAAVRAT